MGPDKGCELRPSPPDQFGIESRRTPLVLAGSGLTRSRVAQ